MTDKKLTVEEIVKGLERCISTTTDGACAGCPFNKQNLCDIDQWALEKYALNLIKCQKAEIVKLKDYNKNLLAANTVLSNEALEIRATAKVETYKAFAEHLKEEWFNNYYDSPDVDFDEFVDNLLKEMVDE